MILFKKHLFGHFSFILQHLCQAVQQGQGGSDTLLLDWLIKKQSAPFLRAAYPADTAAITMEQQ